MSMSWLTGGAVFEYLKIVEQRILEAQRRGEFDNLAHAGKPLVFEDENVPEDLRMAYKILKNSGYLPPEVELRKEIRRMEDMLCRMEDGEDKYRAMKKLNLLVARLNAGRSGHAAFDVPEHYEEKLVERFGRK